MAGRHHMPPHHLLLNRGSRHSLPVRAADLEQELEIQLREMHKIIADNRLVVDDITLLRRELLDIKDEIHGLGHTIPKLQAQKETEARELIQRRLKLEAQLRAYDPLKIEVLQLRAEAEDLKTLCQELITQVQGLKQDVVRAQDENQQIALLRDDIDGMSKELVEARRVYKYEMKANEELVAQRQVKESNLISMAREIQKLRVELMNPEIRARGFVRW